MEVVGAIIFFGGLIALLVIVVRGGLSPPKKPAIPDLTFPLDEDELRVYVFEDGWSEVEKISGGKIANVWETYAWDEREVREILAEAGADPPDINMWTAQIIGLRDRSNSP